MKSFQLLVCICFLAACNRSYQSVTLSSDTVKMVSDQSFEFENDTVRIQYDFQGLNGEMKFRIYNKLPKPLYINWRESAFIIGSQFSTYWQDQFIINGYLYNRFFDWDSYFKLRGPSLYAVVSRQDPISFLPPYSEIAQLAFVVKPGNAYAPSLLHSLATPERITIEKSKIRYLFDQRSTPLQFRNYLTFSTSESGNNKFSYPQTFWVSEIKQTNRETMFGPGLDPGTDLDYYLRGPHPKNTEYLGPQRFILKVPQNGAFDYNASTPSTPVRKQAAVRQ